MTILITNGTTLFGVQYGYIKNNSTKEQQVAIYNWNPNEKCTNEASRQPILPGQMIKVTETATKCYGVPDHGCEKEDLGSGLVDLPWIKDINETGCAEKRKPKSEEEEKKEFEAAQKSTPSSTPPNDSDINAALNTLLPTAEADNSGAPAAMRGQPVVLDDTEIMLKSDATDWSIAQMTEAEFNALPLAQQPDDAYVNALKKRGVMSTILLITNGSKRTLVVASTDPQFKRQKIAAGKSAAFVLKEKDSKNEYINPYSVLGVYKAKGKERIIIIKGGDKKDIRYSILESTFKNTPGTYLVF